MTYIWHRMIKNYLYLNFNYNIENKNCNMLKSIRGKNVFMILLNIVIIFFRCRLLPVLIKIALSLCWIWKDMYKVLKNNTFKIESIIIYLYCNVLFLLFFNTLIKIIISTFYNYLYDHGTKKLYVYFCLCIYRFFFSMYCDFITIRKTVILK